MDSMDVMEVLDVTVRVPGSCGELLQGWQRGEPFHDPWGIRMNFALPFPLVEEAMKRLKEHVFQA